MLAIDAGEVATTLGPPVIKVIGVLIGIKIGHRLIRRVATKAPPKFQRQAGYVLPKVVTVFGVLILLGSLGININSLLAMMATIGLGAALVFTPIGQNLIAGFLAGIDDVVREGDVLSVGDKVGRVVRKGSLSLGVLMPDGSTVYMPNVKAVDDELTNHSRSEGARIEVEIKLDMFPDRAAAVAIMTATLEQLPWRMPDKPTAVLFTEIGANAFHYTCQAWIESKLDAPQRRSMMLTELVNNLEHAGFSIGETSFVAADYFRASQVADPAHEPAASER
ncbi:MAG: mechanosensitive ion channel [Ilumatobacteraceae bacterium]